MRATSYTVGPLATADDDGISVAQTIPGAFGLAIGGALSSGYSATLIAASQARASAGDLTLTAAAANLGGAYVVIASAGNDTGITFTVKGVGLDGISYESETLTGSNTSLVTTTKRFLSVTAITASAAAAGNVSAGISGTTTLDVPRRILITSSGNDSGRTFTVTGTDWNGSAVSESITGPNTTTTYTLTDFKTVTSVTISGSSASTVKVGTNGIASSRPIVLDTYALAPTSLQADVTGTVNYSISQTLDNVALGYTSATWIDHPDTNVVSATADKQANYAYIPAATRITLNSGTGSVKYTVIQASGTPV